MNCIINNWEFLKNLQGQIKTKHLTEAIQYRNLDRDLFVKGIQFKNVLQCILFKILQKAFKKVIYERKTG